MSKASKLGMGASFAQTQPVSARRKAIDAATNAPTEGAPPPVKLPVDMISLNPENPRSELGDLSQLAGSLRDHGQKQAISIMTRYSFLEANPGLDAELEPGAKYVVIDGNSRLAAAREGGLAEIKVTLDEDLGSSPDQLLESALVANIHRNDLDPLDEARALQQLMAVHGKQEALAARLHRSQAWVSQRLALLNLTPELQAKLSSGQEAADLLRRVGNKKPEEQAAHLERLKAAKAAQKKQPAMPAPTTVVAVQDSVPDLPQPSAKQVTSPDGETADVALETPKATEATEHVQVPDPRPEALLKPAPIKMPWSDGAAAMDIAFDMLSKRGQRHAALRRYIELVGGPEGFAQDLLAIVSDDDIAQLLRQLGEHS
ncbi:ParB/RepB/Spo0J family partition protein [Streptomyces zhihengii]|uniref:ParB/RepB/Spo0J family partition protein n=1 Tax=Streptomyces zhihengii TaxID=1818004 RepID=UPI00339F4480